MYYGAGLRQERSGTPSSNGRSRARARPCPMLRRQSRQSAARSAQSARSPTPEAARRRPGRAWPAGSRSRAAPGERLWSCDRACVEPAVRVAREGVEQRELELTRPTSTASPSAPRSALRLARTASRAPASSTSPLASITASWQLAEPGATSFEASTRSRSAPKRSSTRAAVCPRAAPFTGPAAAIGEVRGAAPPARGSAPRRARGCARGRAPRRRSRRSRGRPPRCAAARRGRAGRCGRARRRAGTRPRRSPARARPARPPRRGRSGSAAAAARCLSATGGGGGGEPSPVKSVAVTW